MLSAPLLGLLFAVGAVASAAVVYLRGSTLAGTVAKGTAVAFTVLAVVAFLV